MSCALTTIRQATWHRRLALALACAVLLAGIAQASHFHRDEGRPHGEVHLQCLLCLHSVSNGAPPVLPQLLAGAAIVRILDLPRAAAGPAAAVAAFYDARGPPTR